MVSADELGGAPLGTLPDADDPAHDRPRIDGLWGTLMAGGAGVEWYFGWQNNSPHSDLSAEDWRTREQMYRQTRIALDFFERHLPFDRMQPMDELVVGRGVSCLAAPGEVYALHLPNGGATRFDLGSEPGLYEVRWFDPRNGGDLLEGTCQEGQGARSRVDGRPATRPCDVTGSRSCAACPRRPPPPSIRVVRSAKRRQTTSASIPVGLEHALTGWRVAVGADGIDKIVVLRRGVVVHKGPKADAAQPVWSVTKSFTSTALGLLVGDGGRLAPDRGGVDRAVAAGRCIPTHR